VDVEAGVSVGVAVAVAMVMVAPVTGSGLNKTACPLFPKAPVMLNW
jgi:hypothetical protein